MNTVEGQEKEVSIWNSNGEATVFLKKSDFENGIFLFSPQLTFI